MEIREMVVGDIEELAELYRRFWGEESSIEKMHEKFQELKGNSNYIF